MEQPDISAVNINTPAYWDQVYRQEWERGQVESSSYNRDYGPIHDAIIRLIPDGSRVLDVACGPGILCRKIKRQRPASQVIGVDFSQYTISRNQALGREMDIEYVCLDIRTGLSSLAGGFDVVTMCEIIEHLEKPEKVVDAAMCLLRPGGRFVLTCPHDDQIPDPEHIRRWGHDELFHLLAPYSDTISFVHFPPPYFHVWMMAYLTFDQATAAE
ncbi:MAG: class I SAM-dependent methyltransferase [Chloroflexi bacterium]|nr:class I SAM-dependent methyltransferase [Chloroflexota bacterium]